jgi:chloride channel protein, CIC family
VPLDGRSPVPAASPGEVAAARARHLGDFTLTPRVLVIAALAIPVGAISAGLAWCLLRLIGLCTNLFFLGRLDTALIAPGSGHPAWWRVLLCPVAGGVLVGLMARYGSERIRGHGMPEAIESILTAGSRVQPRVAVLKPVSAAISIGSGGPFGAEGPIIMTGGAAGSILAQLLRLTADERKTLLVAGAAGGMAATFNAPFASVLLAVELLLFEWRPRSLIPVGTAVATATLVRAPLLGGGAVFALPAAGAIHLTVLLVAGCVLAGLACGVLAGLLTSAVYASEDTFARLPVHWMWWPAIGGLIIGLGGLVEPRALGVGYDVIRQLLSGHGTASLIAGILVVKSLIWSLSLGSGTSGGVLAPLLMLGCALGAAGTGILPDAAAGFWPLVCLAGVLGGAMRVPLTAVVFAAELTGRWDMILPLLVASLSAYLLTALLLKRSVLTEKVARRGYHLTREYDVDPLTVLFVREVMDADGVITHRVDDPLEPVLAAVRLERRSHEPLHRQRLFPVLDGAGALRGVVTRRDLLDLTMDREAGASARETVGDVMAAPLGVAHPDDTLRDVAYRMAELEITRMPVVDRADGRLAGMITLPALLAGRLRDLQEERELERVIEVVPIARRSAGWLRRPAGRGFRRRPGVWTRGTDGDGTPRHPRDPAG